MLQIECSNGQIGFGRKRRAIEMSNTDKNKLFEVTMSTFIKVDSADDVMIDQGISSSREVNERLNNYRIFIMFMASVAICTCTSFYVVSTFGIHQEGKEQNAYEGKGSDRRRSQGAVRSNDN